MINRFSTILRYLKNQRVLIIGETFLDAYLQGYAERISREAPVPIIDIEKKTYMVGGAANVATNAASLGAYIYFLSVVGNDLEGKMAKKILKKYKIQTRPIICSLERDTIVKKRIIADNHMLLRFDYGSCNEVSQVTEEKLIDQLLLLWPKIDTVVISDYGYGIITDTLIYVLHKLQKTSPHTMVIDSKYLDKFIAIEATAVKPNYNEAVSLLGLTKLERGENRVAQIISHKHELLEKTNASTVAVTLDTQGALIFERDGFNYRTYADNIENPRVAGAGDTFTAVLSLALGFGADSKTAAELATNASKIAVRKSGTAICTALELQAMLSSQEKFVDSYQALQKLVAFYKMEGKKIVFSNGCFDLLHSGHVKYLNRAKSFGDILILGVNTDESIKKIKGKNRPINRLSDRMQVLTALSCVTHIIPMKEETACNLISFIKPDIYVKGADYTMKTLPEARQVVKYGGKVEFVPLTHGKSTTNLIKQIHLL